MELASTWKIREKTPSTRLVSWMPLTMRLILQLLDKGLCFLSGFCHASSLYDQGFGLIMVHRSAHLTPGWSLPQSYNLSLTFSDFLIVFDLINIAFLSQEIISVLQRSSHAISFCLHRLDHLCYLNLVFSCLFFFQCWGLSPTPMFTIPHTTPESYP